MGAISKLLLGFGLLFTNIETSDLTSENETSDEIVVDEENVENNNDSDSNTNEIEQTELQKLLEQWLNGEIELDDITLEKIYTKLGAVSQEEIDKVLAKYIEDAEEREKLTTILSALITAALSALVVAIYLRKIKAQGLQATINNKTFSESSKVIKANVETLKKDVIDIKEVVESNKRSSDELNQTVLKSLELIDNQFKGLAGVLKINYRGLEDEQGKDAQKE